MRTAVRLSLIVALMLSAASSSLAAPLRDPLTGDAFTFQFTLLRLGQPYTGACDISVSLWDSSSGGTEIGATETFPAMSLSDGQVTLTLDFGTGSIDGSRRWLEPTLECIGDTAPTTASRIELTAAPMALWAREAGHAATADAATTAITATVASTATTSAMYASVPAHSNSTCTAGQYASDASYFYFCVSANTWKRIAYAPAVW